MRRNAWQTPRSGQDGRQSVTVRTKRRGPRPRLLQNVRQIVFRLVGIHPPVLRPRTYPPPATCNPTDGKYDAVNAADQRGSNHRQFGYDE